VTTTSLGDLRRAERIMILFRSVAGVFAAVQVLLYHRLPWPPGFQEIGLVLTAVLILGNLVVWFGYRHAHTLHRARWLAVVTLAFDTVMAASFVWLITFDELSAIWAVLYIMPLEGALRFRLRGALVAWAISTVLFSFREIWGSARYGYQLLWHTVSFKMGIGLLIALVAGIMAEDLVRQRMRLADAFEQLRRSDRFRSDLVSSLTSDVRSPVALILAEAAAKGVGGVRSRVRLFLRGGKEHCYVWPPDTLEDDPFDKTVRVVHQGEEVGDISVAKAEGDPMTDDEQKLLEDLASQAALALRNLRLAGELEERLVELQASRQRIVTAQDQERRRVERDIHDGAQQQLVALAINLGLAKALVAEDPREAERLLDQLKADAREALETLRDLARGLFPPLLVDRGLAAALRSHIEKMGMDAELHADSLATTRFDTQVEAAVYFCCREALQNASKHAPGAHVVVMLAVQDGWLGFSVADNGPGFDASKVVEGSGLRNLTDRLEALGGHLETRSAPGQGTTVAGQVPVKVVSGDDGPRQPEPSLPGARAGAPI
jgi:signal transduction histidine kinase